jgi:predicted nicotinamide N-methyase
MSKSSASADVASALLDDLRGRFDVVTSTLSAGGRQFRIAHPRNADVLIDEEAFDHDERLPYWADVWPSSRVLAERLMAKPSEGRRLLELGCGAGMASAAAAIAGFDVTATDYYEEALLFTRLNVLVNARVEPRLREVDWRLFPHDLGRFDLVIASDVLYEREHAALVASAIDRTLVGHGRAIVADPGRLAAPAFVDECEARGFVVSLEARVPYEDGQIRQTIDMYEMRRR